MVKTIALVSLSSGILGEPYVRHEYDIGIKRLQQFGLQVKIMDNAAKGTEFLRNHPEKRAEDLIQAFKDDSIDMILCAIGGDDTYRLLPYLFDNSAFKDSIKQKIFLGFSDTTINHFMLHKLGIKTFYGQSFLPDICELDTSMLKYTEHYFTELIKTGAVSEIKPSSTWYKERTDFSAAAVGTKREECRNTGFELLQGAARFSGTILGGCLDAMYSIFNNARHADSAALCTKYRLFPHTDEWKGKILLLETSEQKPPVELFIKMLTALKKTGIFEVLNGVIVGKPMDEVYYEEYKQALINVIDNKQLPILYNVNVGHATPRCIIPFGTHAVVDAEKQVIRFEQ